MIRRLRREKRRTLLPATAAVRVGIRLSRDISGTREDGSRCHLPAGSTYYADEAVALYIVEHGFADYINADDERPSPRTLAEAVDRLREDER